MSRVLVIIFDAEGQREYSRYALAPESMPRSQACETVNAAIRKVKDADPDEYQSEDLDEALTQLGFELLETIFSNEVW